ncbi:hypothetical protein DX912_12390, partial [Lysobacter soli]
MAEGRMRAAQSCRSVRPHPALSRKRERGRNPQCSPSPTSPSTPPPRCSRATASRCIASRMARRSPAATGAN